jgi:trehalose synthase-fused probable maltokinase
MAPRPAPDRRLQRLASAFTPEWLAGQRWFRGKSRGVERVELFDAAEIGGTPGWLLVLEATDAGGDHSRYLVPAASDGDALREPGDGDGVWRALGGLTLRGGELRGALGSWQFAPTDAASRLLPGGVDALASLAERRLGVQQSNTSVALGEALVLKLYRLVEPGVNPEVEMSDFLTSVGFHQSPGLAGSTIYLLDGQPHSAAMLQQLVASQDDGWNWILERMAAGRDGAAEAVRAIGLVGRLTARMHAALASRPETPGFPSREATPDELGAWHAGALRRLDTALGVLDETSRPRLAAVAPLVGARLAAIGDARSIAVSRIHGDYHLGQLLRTADGFAVIDFEGEPARSIAERRAPASPLRDVAGMLRSLDYAAQTAARRGPSDAGTWLTEARGAFLDGYGGISQRDAPILAAFEIEKACYEVAYEANNRPDWTWLPLEALERQAATD